MKKMDTGDRSTISNEEETRIDNDDLGARSGYITILPHTRRVGLLDVEVSQKSLVVIAGKGFGEEIR